MPKLNFFTPYVEEKKATFLRSKPMLILIIMLIAAFTYLFFQTQIHLLEKELAEKEQELNAVKTTQLNEVVEIKRKITEQRNYQLMAERLGRELERADFVKLQLMEKILETVPQNLFFQDLRITREDISLLGFADSRQTIARFEYNLKECELFDKITIGHINTSTMVNKGQVFIFNLNGTFEQEVL